MMNYMRIFIFLLTLLPFMATSQEQEKLSIEKLWKLNRVSEPQLSPDGKMVIYGVRTYDVKSNKSTNIIYSCTNNGEQLKPISTSKQNASSARWRPDGKKILFLSNTESGTQLFEMNLDGTEAIQITFIQDGINGYQYSPDGKKLAYTADVKLDLEVKEIYPDLDKTNARIIDGLLYRHWDSWHDFKYSHVFIAELENGKIKGNPIDIMAGEKYDCPLQPHGGDDDYTWSKDGSMLAYSCKKEIGTQAAYSTNSDIYVYNLKDKSTFNASFRNTGYDRAPQFSPDGSKLAWLSMKKPGYESDKNNLKIFQLKPINTDEKSGNKAAVEPVENLTSNFDFTIEEFQWMDNSKVMFTAVKEATKNFFIYDPKSKNINNIIQLTKGEQDFTGFSYGMNLKKGVLISNRTRIDFPTEVFSIDLTTGKEKQISFVNSDILKNTQMGRVEKRWVKATDGKQILTWVIYPPDFDATKKYPTLLYCQGGPQSPVSQGFSYRWNFQLMAANGYIVVAPNRRGLPGFGSEWNDAIQGDYGGQCMKDYLSAIDAVSAEPFVNKDRLGAVGASFGGFSVYWLAGHHERKFKAFIAHCGMFNMESWYGSTEEMFFAQNDNIGPYWSQSHPNNFDSSPHKFVQNWNTPILVIHNEKDFRVPITQGMEAFTAAQTMGVPSKFLYFPDENHWVIKPQNSILWQRVFFEWLDQWLKDIPQKK